MRKGCCRMAAAFSLRKEYQMTGKNERKLKKWAALFLAAAMSLTACGSTASTGSSTSSASGTSAVSESSTSTASAADVSESRTESTSVSESTAESESTSEATAASSTSGNDTASADGFATTDDVSDAPDITGITIERYLTHIPQRITNLRKTDWITSQWFSAQDDLLDALDAALAASVNGDDDDSDTGKPALIPFRNKLELLTDDDVFESIRARFARSSNSIHAAAAYKLHRVWSIADERRSAYESVLGDLKHHRSLWHGTTAGNVLSILRTGLICPPMNAGSYSTTGRMFGDGVYFSDQSTKSLNYALGAAPGQSGRGAGGGAMMFLADVAMGREYRPNSSGWDTSIPHTARTGTDEKGRPWNSIFVRGGTCGVRNNEMIVWNTDQITLTHLCEFKR